MGCGHWHIKVVRTSSSSPSLPYVNGDEPRVVTAAVPMLLLGVGDDGSESMVRSMTVLSSLLDDSTNLRFIAGIESSLNCSDSRHFVKVSIMPPSTDHYQHCGMIYDSGLYLCGHHHRKWSRDLVIRL